MTTTDFDRRTAKSLVESESLRVARGWLRVIGMGERLRRLDEGRPLLELMKDKNPARARLSG